MVVRGLVVGGFLKRLFVIENVKEPPEATAEEKPISVSVSKEVAI